MNRHQPLEPRVLIADDDHSIRQLLGTIIRREQIAADLAADGQEAIDRLKEREYSVILLDLMMPRVDGFGVIDYLRQHPPNHKPVILVISAYADQKFRDVDPEVVAGVVRKPFEVAELGNLVRLCATGFEDALQRGVVSSLDDTLRVLPPSAIAELESLRDEEGGHGPH